MRRDAIVIFGMLSLVAGPVCAQTALHRLRGDADGRWFGYGVAALGDVNGDGTPDFAVASPGSGGGTGVSAGAVDVFSGRDHALLYRVVGDADGDALGSSLVALGDVDGDGVCDFAASAPQWIDFLVTGNGYVRVFSGKDGSTIRTLQGAVADTAFGATVGAPGDVDADGVPDLCVGSWWESTGSAANCGAMRVFSGATGNELFTFTGDGHLDYVGFSFAGVGDLNGDGHADFAMGANGDVLNGVRSGVLRVFSGADFSILYEYGRSIDGLLGQQVAGGGDVDGDGIDDFAVSDSQEKDDPDFPRVFVYSGANGALIRQFSGLTVDELFGYGLSIAADVDGDGYADVAVGAPRANPEGAGWHGSLRVFSGRTGGLLFEDVPDEVDDFGGYGFQVAAVGDLNGDGLDELVASSTYADGNHVDEGMVRVVTGADLHASWHNYGQGWPGTLCDPTLVVDAAPQLGSAITLSLANSLGADTFALLLGGFTQATIPTSAGGTLLVAPPWLTLPLAVPAAGLDLGVTVPADVTLAGLAFDLQALELDPGASHGLSFTPGLELVFGG